MALHSCNFLSCAGSNFALKRFELLKSTQDHSWSSRRINVLYYNMPQVSFAFCRLFIIVFRIFLFLR
ncbi:hypothetical protein BD408DRAFT_103321 [Parasitella parasitica]|nr:hypothetical protein BD408DRAFT_103321 [Parasitella parasitica]